MRHALRVFALIVTVTIATLGCADPSPGSSEEHPASLFVERVTVEAAVDEDLEVERPSKFSEAFLRSLCTPHTCCGCWCIFHDSCHLGSTGAEPESCQWTTECRPQLPFLAIASDYGQTAQAQVIAEDGSIRFLAVGEAVGPLRFSGVEGEGARFEGPDGTILIEPGTSLRIHE